MTNTYKFISGNNSINNSFHTKKTNYSKIIDNIIIDDIINKNSYLFNKNKKEVDLLEDLINNTNYTPKSLKADDYLIKAIKLLAGCNTKKKLPILLNKWYELEDGTLIIFRDDEIQIGFDVYHYSDFENIEFIKSLTPKKKKTIISIFTNSPVDININL